MTQLTELVQTELSKEELNAKISELGRQRSAIDNCELFCTPPGIKTILAPVLEGTDRRIGHYSRNAKETMDALQQQQRAIRPTNYQDLVKAIEHVQPNQLVLIPAGVIPGDIKFLKRGTTLPVRQKEGKTLDTALVDALKTVTPEQRYSGYDFQGKNYTNRDFKLIALIDVIRGCIYDQALTTAIRIEFYEGDKPMRTGIRAGITQMPSFHNERKEYLIGFAGVPVYRGTRKDLAPSQGFDLTQLSDSPREIWDVVKFKRDMPQRDADRTGHEQRWDHHVILAYQRLARKLQEEGWNVIKPYAEPSPKTIQFYWKMLNNCLVESEEEKYELNPLRIDQAEFLLWKRVGAINYARRNNTNQS